MTFQFYARLNGRKVFIEGHVNSESRFEIEACIDDVTGLDVTLTENEEMDLEQDAFERLARIEKEEECFV